MLKGGLNIKEKSIADGLKASSAVVDLDICSERVTVSHRNKLRLSYAGSTSPTPRTPREPSSLPHPPPSPLSHAQILCLPHLLAIYFTSKWDLPSPSSSTCFHHVWVWRTVWFRFTVYYYSPPRVWVRFLLMDPCEYLHMLWTVL